MSRSFRRKMGSRGAVIGIITGLKPDAFMNRRPEYRALFNEEERHISRARLFCNEFLEFCSEFFTPASRHPPNRLSSYLAPADRNHRSSPLFSRARCSRGSPSWSARRKFGIKPSPLIPGENGRRRKPGETGALGVDRMPPSLPEPFVRSPLTAAAAVVALVFLGSARHRQEHEERSGAKEIRDDGRGRAASAPSEIPKKGWKDILWR